MRRCVLMSLAMCAALGIAAEAWAQQPAAPAGPPPAQYGTPGITLEQAKKAADAAEAEAKKNGWTMAIAVVSNGGWLVHFSKIDNTQFASIEIAQHKAKAAATFRRPTKTFEDRLAAGGAGLAVLMLDGAIASEGGIPIMVGGKVIGAMGCSGGTGAQDGQACMAGVNAVK
jgi:glc operon protein GlcG